MGKITIVRGVHRNEYVAFWLAAKVFQKLKSEGRDITLITEPGFHHLFDNFHKLPADDRAGLKPCISEYAMPASSLRLIEVEASTLFDFHNSPDTVLNPENIPGERLPISYDSCHGRGKDFPSDGNASFYDKNIYHLGDNNIGWWAAYRPFGISFSKEPTILTKSGKTAVNNYFTVELPAVYTPYPPEKIERYLTVMQKLCLASSSTFMHYGDNEFYHRYLSQYANLSRSRKKGYIGKTMIDRLSRLILRIEEVNRIFQ